MTVAHPIAGAIFRRSYASPLCLGLLTIALGYAVFHNGGVDIADWTIALLFVGIAGAAYLLYKPLASTPHFEPWLRWAILLLPCYIAFQLIPLPVSLVRILSPERAELFQAVRNLTGSGAFAPLSVQAETTIEYLFRILCYTVTFLLLRDITARWPGQRAWTSAFPLIGVAGIEAAFGFLRKTGEDPMQGSYGNKNHFAGLLEMTLPFAVMYTIALFRNRPHAKLQVLKSGAMAALALLILAGLGYSISKMGFVSGLFGLFVMGVLALRNIRIPPWKKTSAIGGLAVCLLLVFLVFPPDEMVQAFGGVVSSTGSTTEGRWPIWTDTLRLIGTYPLFGCGLGNYGTAFLKYQTAIPDRDFTFAHNDYLQLAAELGAAGCIILVILLLSILTRAIRAATQGESRDTRYLGLACVGGMAAIGLHDIADFNMYIPGNAMLLAWIGGIAVGLPSRPVRVEASARVRAFFRAFAAAISCLLIVYALAQVAAAKHGGNASTASKAELIEAVRKDPAAPQRWSDLGQAFLNGGDREKAKYCFLRAVALGPNIPFVLVKTADFWFAVKDTTRALELLARVWALDPAYQDVVITAYQQRRLPIDQVLRYGLPPDAGVFKEYLHWLLIHTQADNAAKTWAWIMSHGYADDKMASEYVQSLLDDKKYEAAQQAWAGFAHASDRSYPERNRVFNGSFESQLSASPLDWTIEPVPGAVIDFDRAVHYSGAQSLRMRFDGTQNVTKIGVTEKIFLKPGHYRLEAYLRTEDVSTDEGVALRVIDPDQPNLLNVTTESAVGTNGWKLVQHTFAVLPDTKLVELSLIRKSSLRFDNLIRGTVWVDAVAITPSR
jgi:O-antigen ligase